ncbi:MAG: helix-turn-helix transcriptional regulator [Ruminococcus sp.]|jgi:putative transcriptional regulator|nr:helix-turn-helix transcriptional regulator [Ruminococcus sp.]
MPYLHIRIQELLTEKGISKNRICKDLDLPRGNFNKYCRDDFQRIDANLIVKLCTYLECDIEDLIVMIDDGEPFWTGD